jgi:glycosyltransferase involved in cell wall biosynthesis
MRIAIDAHMVGERETGNETYTLNLVRALTAHPAIQRGNHQLLLYTTHPDSLAPRLEPEARPWIRRIRPEGGPLRISVGMPLAALRDDVDLLHVTYVAPPVSRCRRVVTVHDISFDKYPAFFSLRDRLMLSSLVPLSMRRASRVITVSQHARLEILERYKLAAHRVAVTYEAAAEQYRPVTDRAVLADVQRRYRLPSSFILALGNLQPRKNLARLVDAYSHARQQGHLDGVHLVLAGKAMWRQSELFERAQGSGYGGDIVFPGYIADADLPALFSAALAYVYPSLYEGFGLPPLEAMACGAPVICSNAASLPEVTGDAALSFEPHDTAALTAALIRVHVDRELAAELRQRGLRQAARFSWTRCADETLAVYQEAMSSAGVE